ncbi:hypothetical protein [Colwellia sp. E150_009]
MHLNRTVVIGIMVLVFNLTLVCKVNAFFSVLDSPVLSIQENSRNFTVSWTGVEGATSYQLENSYKEQAWQIVGSYSVTAVDFSKLSSGDYRYRVSACNSTGCSEPSVQTEVTEISLAYIDERLNIHAETRGDGLIYMFVSNSHSDGVFDLNYQGQANPTITGTLSNISWNELEDVASRLLPGGGFRFTISLCTSNGCTPQSYWSSWLYQTPRIISSLLLTTVDSQLDLTWQHANMLPMYYFVEQSINDEPYQHYKTLSDIKQLQIENLTDGYYQYRVKACIPGREICSTFVESENVYIGGNPGARSLIDGYWGYSDGQQSPSAPRYVLDISEDTTVDIRLKSPEENTAVLILLEDENHRQINAIVSQTRLNQNNINLSMFLTKGRYYVLALPYTRGVASQINKPFKLISTGATLLPYTTTKIEGEIKNSNVDDIFAAKNPRFKLTLAEEEYITVEFHTFLSDWAKMSLVDKNNEVIVTTRVSSKKPNLLMLGQNLEAGEYTIILSTVYESGSGNYTLYSLHPDITPLIPSIKQGQWAAGVANSPITSNDMRYLLTVNEAQQVNIDLETELMVGAWFQLLDQHGQVLLDGVRDESDNKRITISKYLAAGQYQLVASTYNDTTASEFTVSTYNGVISNMPQLVVDTKNGSWSSSAGQNTTSFKNPHYWLDIDKKQQVKLKLHTDQFLINPYLYLLAENGQTVTIGERININGWVKDAVIDRLLMPGRYQVVAATSQEGKTADFTLSTNYSQLVERPAPSNAPEMPSCLIAPNTVYANQQYQVRWCPIDGVEYYQLSVNNQVQQFNPWENFTIEQNIPGDYSYQISACNHHGCSSQTPIQTVTVSDETNVVNFRFDDNGDSENPTGQFVVSWDNVSNATGYQLTTVYHNFSGQLIETTIDHASTQLTAIINLPDDAINGEVYFTLKTFGSGDIPTQVLQGDMLRSLAEPENLSLINNLTSDEYIQIKWDAVAHADYYQVYTFASNGSTTRYPKVQEHTSATEQWIHVPELVNTYIGQQTVPGIISMQVKAYNYSDQLAPSALSLPADIEWRTPSTGGMPPVINQLVPAENGHSSPLDRLIVSAEVVDDGSIEKVIFTLYSHTSDSIVRTKEISTPPYSADFGKYFDGGALGTYSIKVTAYDNYGKNTSESHRFTRDYDTNVTPTIESISNPEDNTFIVNWTGGDAVKHMIVRRPIGSSDIYQTINSNAVSPTTITNQPIDNEYRIFSCFNVECTLRKLSATFELKDTTSLPSIISIKTELLGTAFEKASTNN